MNFNKKQLYLVLNYEIWPEQIVWCIDFYFFVLCCFKIKFTDEKIIKVL